MQPHCTGLSTGSRRGFRGRGTRAGAAITALLAAVAVLAGCGSTPAADPVDNSVTVTHKFGETEIPRNPTNVVTVGWNDQDLVLALDVVPVATREWFDGYDDFPWVKEATGGKVLPTLGGDGIDYESIATAKPDVIFAVYETIDRPTYDRLSQIAPTVIQPDDHPDEETPWDVQLLLTGKAGQGAFDSHLSGALSCSGPEALLYALDRLVPQLANAVNGRPVADLSHA